MRQRSAGSCAWVVTSFDTRQSYWWLSCGMLSLARRAHVSAIWSNATWCSDRMTTFESRWHSAERSRQSSGLNLRSSVIVNQRLCCQHGSHPRRAGVGNCHTGNSMRETALSNVERAL